MQQLIKVDYKDIPESGRGSPDLNYCRELIKQGVDLDTKIEFYRGDKKCLIIKSIEIGSKLTTSEEPVVHFRKYEEHHMKVSN